MAKLELVPDLDPHQITKTRAESIAFATLANAGDMQRIRKEARGRLKGDGATEADLLRVVGRIVYEEAFFVAQGLAQAEFALDAAVAEERKRKAVTP